MTDIDEQLAVALERRAQSVIVRPDLESILAGTNVISFADPAARPRPRRRSRLLLVAAAGLVAITGGLVWAQTVRNEPAATSGQPTPPDESALAPVPDAGSPAAWDLPDSANPDRIDAYPIVDDLPASADTNISFQTGDGGAWIGSIGTLQPDGVPALVVAVSTFTTGFEPFPDAPPGRVAGVSEISGGGRATLAWTVDGTSLTLTGADLDTMYSIVDHIVPSSEGSDRGGYSIIGDLPLGLIELEAPYEFRSMEMPALVSELGEVSVHVSDGPFLSIMAASGIVDREPITIGSLSGFIAADRLVEIGSDRRVRTLIALALSGDEILFVSSTTMSREQLIDFAGTIRISDEAEFRSVYGVTDSPPLTTDFETE